MVNGEKSRLTIGVSWADLFDQGNLGFDALACFFFPTIFHNERLQEIALTEEQVWGAKGEFERKTANYPRITPNDNSGYYALSTPEETEVLSTRLTDLATYSRELAADPPQRKIKPTKEGRRPLPAALFCTKKGLT